MAPKKAAKKSAKKAAPKKAKKASSGKKRVPSAAFMKPMQPSPQLAAIVGSGKLPRTEITRKVWIYIKKNNLQDKKNRRMINADSAMREIFKKDQVSMFDMTKLVSKHLS